jgi:uncharacterized protein DUF3618
MTQPSKSFPKTSKDVTENKDAVKSSREIESEIAETRNAISSDIKALNDKFTPSNVKEQAKEQAKEVFGGVKDAAMEQGGEIKDAVVEKAIEVKDAVVEKAVEIKDAAAETAVEAKDAVVDAMQEVGDQAVRAGSATWRFTKANAVPLALLGVGAGMMIANSRRSRVEYEPDYLLEEREEVWESEGGAVRPHARRIVSGPETRRASSNPRTPRQAKMNKSNGGGRMGARSQSVVSQATEGLEHAGSAAMDTASRGADYVQDKATRGYEFVQDSAKRSYEYAQRNLRRAGTASRDFATANPLLTALAAVAAGVSIGMLLPATDRENKLLAPPREKFKQLLGDVRDAATDVAQVAKDTASDSMQAMK